MAHTINTVEKLDDRIYRITELGSVHRYLVLGDEKAMLVDTGWGFEDFRPLITEITQLPLTVVNSHGHNDHCFGNYYFEEVYLNEKDWESMQASHNPRVKQANIDYRKKKNPWFEALLDEEAYLARDMDGTKLLPIGEGDVLDLGGISFTAYEVPGHSAGSIALYSPQLKCLFGGDSINSHPIWYVGDFESSLPLSTFLQSLTRLKEMVLDIAAIYPGHGETPIGADVLDRLIGCIHDLAAHPENDPEVENSGNVGRQHDYMGTAIIYSPAHLKALQDSLGKE
ncbi:MBL fold metallo-hydrolase [Eubacteriales bacterium OttesenSCG-928-M02]|nr:MBL fold metallo-hydrolase [Eubacteriales bacterium OttesenSCG-928-M02]